MQGRRRKRVVHSRGYDREAGRFCARDVGGQLAHEASGLLVSEEGWFDMLPPFQAAMGHFEGLP